MIVGDNKLVSLFQYAFGTLSTIYPEDEAKNITLRLFEYFLNKSRTDIVIYGEELLSESEILKIHFAIKRLKLNEPVQYIIGETEFYGLGFKVDKNVLIPRPETEELIEWILLENPNSNLQALDIGTGSGCIAIALKSKWKDAEVFACDISDEALEIAELNAKKLNHFVRFFKCDVLKESVPLKELDIIISNPPYIPLKEKESMDSNVADYEPQIALFVEDEDPFIFYRKIAELGMEKLKIGGKIYLEIHKDFSKEIGEIIFNAGYTNIKIRKDISSNDRMIRAQKK